MKTGFVKSSPHFFRPIKRAMLIFTLILLALAALCPAPLKEAANPALTPNPVKSAWFLLWIQEVVSWSRLMIWPVACLAIMAFLLPWLPGQTRSHYAGWFLPGQRRVAITALVLCAAVLALTATAMFLRGANWSLDF
jgi:hypothetical protein